MEGIDWRRGGRLAAVIRIGRKYCVERDGSGDHRPGKRNFPI